MPKFVIKYVEETLVMVIPTAINKGDRRLDDKYLQDYDDEPIPAIYDRDQNFTCPWFNGEHVPFEEYCVIDECFSQENNTPNRINSSKTKDGAEITLKLPYDQ